MSQASVLIVEDDLFLAEAYAAVLRHADIEYEVVHDGDQALRRAKALRPDVLLLDLRMAKLGGLEVLRRLRPKQTLPRTKVIIFTNYNVQTDIDEAFRLGASHYLLKSFVTPRHLIN
ncbi:MAG: response regulator transcription factor, partial [Candidatus Saccharimonadales bacterium]